MVPNGDVTPNGATRCTARAKATGQQCRRWSVAGATVCVVHGGRAPQVRAKAAERLQRAEAERVVRKLGGRLDIAGGDAITELVQEAAWNVTILRAIVGDLEDELLSSEPVGQYGSRDVPNIYLTLYAEWCDRLARYSEKEVSLGIAERRQQLAEAKGEMLAALLRAFISDAELALSPEQRALAPVVLRRHWQAISATATEVA